MTIARRVLSVTIQLTLSNGVVRLLAFLTMPILTSLLSPNAYGLAALFGTVISLMSVFALAGIDISYARSYGSSELPNGTRAELFCWRFAVVAAIPIAVVSAVVWDAIFRDSAELDRGLAILLALSIVLAVTHTMAQTRARLAGRYRTIASSTIASGVIGAALSVGIAIWWRQDALVLVLPMMLSYLIPVLLLRTPPVGKLVRFAGLNRHERFPLIKIGLAAIVTAPMYWVLSSSDRWFLQYFHGASAVGVYSIGYSVAIIGMMLNVGVMAVWIPEAIREYEQDRERAKRTLGRLMSRLMAAMALVWLIATAAGGDVIRLLANERFHGAVGIVPYIAGGVLFYGIAQLASYGLVLVRKLKWAAIWWIVGGMFCGALNLLLVPDYGAMGAAITQTASFCAISVGMLATSQLQYRVQLDWGRLLTVLLLIFVAGFFLTKTWHLNPLISLLVKLPIGLTIAIVTLMVIAPDWFDRIKNRIATT